MWTLPPPTHRPPPCTERPTPHNPPPHNPPLPSPQPPPTHPPTPPPPPHTHTHTHEHRNTKTPYIHTFKQHAQSWNRCRQLTYIPWFRLRVLPRYWPNTTSMECMLDYSTRSHLCSLALLMMTADTKWGRAGCWKGSTAVPLMLGNEEELLSPQSGHEKPEIWSLNKGESWLLWTHSSV